MAHMPLFARKDYLILSFSPLSLDLMSESFSIEYSRQPLPVDVQVWRYHCSSIIIKVFKYSVLSGK